MNESCKKGEHNKCYASAMLLGNPPTRMWICRHCLAEGTEVVGEAALYPDEFSRLKELKAKKKQQWNLAKTHGDWLELQS